MDILTPRENQHSDILSWCFNAREGHGQGDALLKDFLISVYHRSTENEPGDKIKGKGLTSDFVKKWNPIRILTSSFSTAFCIREYKFLEGAGDRRDNRLDLLIIDLENKILVIIENKAGAKFRDGQLSGYVEATQKTIRNRPVFKDFDIAFVALDKNADADEEPAENENFDSRWARLDYGWLKPGSKRAEMAVHRGNQGAALLLSYCRAQTGYESENELEISKKARDLAIEYPEIISKFREISKGFAEPSKWTPIQMSVDNEEGQLIRLYLQNKDSFNRILGLSPLWLLEGKLQDLYPDLGQNEGRDGARVWCAYRLPIEHVIPMHDDHWPLFLRIRHINFGMDSTPKFKLNIRWNPHCVPTSEVGRICEFLSSKYPSALGTERREKGMLLASEVVDGVDAAVISSKKHIAAIQAAFTNFN